MPGRILIADDLASQRILLKARLAGAPYTLVTPQARAAALDMALAEPFDLALVDLGSPLHDGLDLILALRAHPKTASLAILALAPDDASTRSAALEAGADAVLFRGAGAPLLLARIRSLMRARLQEADLALREEAETALGFAESSPAFETPGRIALIVPRAATAENWRQALAARLRDRVSIELPLQDDLAAAATPPDVYVIAADLARRHDGLRLVADLRSSAASRHSAILTLVAPGDEAAAAEALDLGADDIAQDAIDPAELVLRVRALLRRKARADRLRRRVSDGLRLAVRDPLTGLHNRRYALARLARIAEESVASGRTFAVMVLDLDRFKQVNDRFGHVAGDAALTEIARRLAQSLRAEDLVARLGGEEFLVAMPNTSADAARLAAERLRTAVAAEPIAVPGLADAIRLTVSVGVAVGGTMPAAPVDTLVGAADRALYSAKAGGRNRVTFGQGLRDTRARVASR